MTSTIKNLWVRIRGVVRRLIGASYLWTTLLVMAASITLVSGRGWLTTDPGEMNAALRFGLHTNASYGVLVGVIVAGVPVTVLTILILFAAPILAMAGATNGLSKKKEKPRDKEIELHEDAREELQTSAQKYQRLVEEDARLIASRAQLELVHRAHVKAAVQRYPAGSGATVDVWSTGTGMVGGTLLGAAIDMLVGMRNAETISYQDVVYMLGLGCVAVVLIVGSLALLARRNR